MVVIAVIGILIALLLPAVQAAREAARRAQCVNNLKQLGLGMLNYENAHKVFPVNWCTDYSSAENMKGHSWLTGVLPFIEEGVLYGWIKMGKPLSDNILPNNPDEPPRQVVPEFNCPSDNHYGTMKNQHPVKNAVWGVTNYKACAGMNWHVSVKADSSPGGPAIKWIRGRNANSSDGFEHGNGIICRGNLTVTNPPPTLYVTAIRDIRDGTSKTFAIGEAVPQWCSRSAWYDFNGATATCGIPLNYKNPTKLTDAEREEDPDYNLSFMSRHRGGANFCMCDGSVNFIADDIEYIADYTTTPPTPGVYMKLATIDGGELAKIPD